MLLRQHGADVTVTGTDRLLAACQDADRAKVERLLAADPGLPGRIPAAQQAAAMIHAAESGNTAAITLLLDLGFPVDARGDDGGTPLHAAADSGSAPAVRLLLERGAGVEARDITWDSTPMEWAAIGSGEQPASHPHPDWTGTVQALLDAGASAGTSPCHPMTTGPPHPGPGPAGVPEHPPDAARSGRRAETRQTRTWPAPRVEEPAPGHPP